MLPSYDTVRSLLSMLVYVLAVCVLLDITLIYSMKKCRLKPKNAYYDFHIRHGFIKIAALKVLAFVCLVYLLLHPPLNGGALAVLVLAYFVIIGQLLLDFIRVKRSL